MATAICNLDPRACEECGVRLSRNIGEATSAWVRRRFCSVKCARTFGPKRPIDQRIAGKTDKAPGHGPNGDCHVWTASKDANGYGHIRYQQRTWLAHRVVYLLTHGSLSDDVFVCHRCDNPSCVNPSHLFIGTQQDNMDDMVSKGRQRFLSGESHVNSKLTQADVENIRSDTRLHRVIAAQYGVSRGLVSHIKRGVAWKRNP